MKGRLLMLIACILTLTFPLLLIVAGQDVHLEGGQSLCPFKMLFGFPCPGCGITKSLVFLYEGDLVKSFSYHLFGPPLFLSCVAGVSIITFSLITKRVVIPPGLFGRKTAYAIATTLFFYHAVRLVHFLSNNSLHSIAKESIWI